MSQSIDGHNYALTWAPRGTTIDPLTKYYEYIESIFRKWRPALDFAIYPELNASGNIHYHACMTVLDKIAWYRRLLPQLKRKGFVCIRKITSDKWKEYCEKDRETFSKVFIPYPLTPQNFPRKVKEKHKPDLDYGIGIMKFLIEDDEAEAPARDQTMVTGD